MTLLVNTGSNSHYFMTKQCPILSNKEQEIIHTLNFDFDDEFYKKFNKCISDNPGRTLEELVNIIDFYHFNPYSLEMAFKLFNTWKCTYYKICGPFILRDHKWFPVYNTNNADSIIASGEIDQLKTEIQHLKNIIANLEEKLKM